MKIIGMPKKEKRQKPILKIIPGRVYLTSDGGVYLKGEAEEDYIDLENGEICAYDANGKSLEAIKEIKATVTLETK